MSFGNSLISVSSHSLWTWNSTEDNQKFPFFSSIWSFFLQEHIFSAAGRDLLDLLQSLLILDPCKRCTCTEALNMPYFKNKPAPSLGHQLPLPASVRSDLDMSAGVAQPGIKRKHIDRSETSALAKRLVFWIWKSIAWK